MEQKKYVIFRLQERKYGIDLMSINGIEQSFQIIPVPNAPSGVKGIINLRGEVIPVYSLKQRFGMVKGDDKIGNRLLITRSSGVVLGYEVDDVVSIEEVEPEQISKMPQMVSTDDNVFMDKVLRIKDDIVVIINVDEVLSEKTKESLKQIIEENKENQESGQD